MVKKITNLVLLLLAMYPTGSFAQEFGADKKSPQLGVSLNLTRFAENDFSGGGKYDKGFSLLFWNGYNKYIDYSVRYNGVFSNYSKNPTGKDVYLNELEGAFHGRLMGDNHLVQPFATLGLGFGKYSQVVVPYFPVGLGVQVNMYNEGYVFLQANYRVSANTAKLDNNMFYSLGYTVPIFNRTVKAKVVPPPPPPPPAPKVVVVTDRDGDGVPDSLDQCPDVKGLALLHGCPDTDGDGIADKDDKCPDVTGIAKYQGCPIPDTDGDGVNDEIDQCPAVPGTAANNGCPEIKKEVKEEIKKKVELNAKDIYFSPASDKILNTSFKSLDEVAEILKADKSLKLDISGHTDNTGDAAKNKLLSEQRAKAVNDYLVSKGVDAANLTSVGFGQEKPVADNSTKEGRTMNRRVELKLKY